MASTIIQSLDRGLKIMNILGIADRPLSLNDISGYFDIDRSSIFRLVATLMHNGYVRQDEETKKYSLGFRIMELSGAIGEQTKIETIIRPVIQRVCAATRQNTHLAILDGTEVVFIAVEQPRDSLSVHITVGTRESAGATALGKALISNLDGTKMEEVLGSLELKRYTGRTIISKDELREHLAAVRRKRIAVDDEEYKAGIVCFAAPVLNNRNEAEYSLGISGPRDRMIERREEFMALVRDAGIEVSRLLGSSVEPCKGI
jgi:IclR family transcriptional regulator, KDG regulon repressor